METVFVFSVHNRDLETRRLEELIGPVAHHRVLIGKHAAFAQLRNESVLEEVVGLDVLVCGGLWRLALWASEVDD
jgi:hypothetical protein